MARAKRDDESVDAPDDEVVEDEPVVFEPAPEFVKAVEEAPEPLPMAEPGMYRYTGETPTEHPLLGFLVPGETYDYRAVTHEEVLHAIAASVAHGAMEKA